MDITQKYLDDLTYELVGAAIEVHKAMGRGLLESVYHECLKEELLHRKINFLSELKIPVSYRSKSINEFSAIHEAQLLNYMKLLKAPKGILINFNCNNIFHEGQKTLVNQYFSDLPKQ